MKELGPTVWKSHSIDQLNTGIYRLHQDARSSTKRTLKKSLAAFHDMRNLKGWFMNIAKRAARSGNINRPGIIFYLYSLYELHSQTISFPSIYETAFNL